MKVIRYETVADMKKSVDTVSFEISKAIVEEISKNIDKKEPYIILSLYTKEADSYLDFTMDPKEHKDALLINLENFEKMEDYEGCFNIMELIKKIK